MNRTTLGFYAFLWVLFSLIGCAYLYLDGKLTLMSALLLVAAVPVLVVGGIVGMRNREEPYIIWDMKDVNPEDPNKKDVT